MHIDGGGFDPAAAFPLATLVDDADDRRQANRAVGYLVLQSAVSLTDGYRPGRSSLGIASTDGASGCGHVRPCGCNSPHWPRTR